MSSGGSMPDGGWTVVFLMYCAFLFIYIVVPLAVAIFGGWMFNASTGIWSGVAFIVMVFSSAIFFMNFLNLVKKYN